MIWTYFKLASRNLVRDKFFSSINILGLSVSMIASMLILHYVRFELSYDDFHHHANKIYRVATKVTLQDRVINHEANTYEGISRALRNEFEEVLASTTVYQYDSDRNFIRYERDGKGLITIQSFKALDVDNDFFNVFSFELLQGNKTIVLRDPYSAIISETFSKQYFENEAIGRFIDLYDGAETKRYRITGVLKDVAPNSHIKFDLLTRSEPQTTNFWNEELGFWDWTGQTYIRIRDEVEPVILEEKLNDLAKVSNGLKRNKDDYGQVSTFQLQPLTEIHLFSHLQEELEKNGSGLLVYALVILAIIIICMAWINYINLSTAISDARVKSIGIRKVTGASRRTLGMQVLVEACIFNGLAIAIALVVVQFVLPAFSRFAGIPLDYSSLYDKWLLVYISVFLFVGTFLSGIYPAIIISGLHPVMAVQGRIKIGGITFRKALVSFQFGAAVLIMIATTVLYQQLAFMQDKELGFTIDQVIIVKSLNFDKEKWSDSGGGYEIDSTYAKKAELFKDQIRSHAGFVNATSLSHLPGQLPNWGTEFKADVTNKEHAYRLVAMGIDVDFLSTLQVRLLAGRNFSRDFPTDRGNEGKRAILINETTCHLLGFASPEHAINKHVSTYWGADYEIIGVVKSFHQLSLKENLQPTYFILQPRALDYFAIRYQGESVTKAIENLRGIWQQHFPDYPFNYFFLDQYFHQQYEYEEKFRDIMTFFSGLAIMVACLGLLGLTSFDIVRRTREIGIRKVLGASASNVITLFTGNFVKLILVATAFTVPLVYLGANRWLEHYAFRIRLDWWYFFLPVLVVLAIAIVTIGAQTIRAARRNPVDSLKHE